MTDQVCNDIYFLEKENPNNYNIELNNVELEILSYKALRVIRDLLAKTNNAVAICRSDAINELIKSGLVSNSIQANEVLRWLEDNEEIFPVENSGLLKVITYRNISNFDRHQQQLQKEWLTAGGKKELRSSCATQEAREIAAAAIVREEEEQLQQQKKKRRHYHNNNNNNKHRQQQPKEQQPQQQMEVYFLK